MRRSAALLSLGALAVAGLVAYGFMIEPRQLKTTRLTVGGHGLGRVLAGRSVALLSDLHFGLTAEPLYGAVGQILRETRPDIILLAGDYVGWGSDAKSYERALDFLASLQAPLGVYAVLGEADRTFSRKSCEFCHVAGSGAPTDRHRVSVLKNETRVLDLPVGSLRIVGLDTDFPAAGPRLSELLAGDLPSIVISHSSLVYRGIDPGKDVLVVSGDTHGGQVWLPGWFWRIKRFKPDPEHIQGLFRDGRKSLVVTRGVGTSHLRFRLGVPPEIVILDFPGDPH